MIYQAAIFEDVPVAEPDEIARLRRLDSAALASERTAILASEMAGLSEPYREVLTLRFEEGMKLEEIAEVTHAPLSTVKSRVQRGLEAMKQKLAKEDMR